MTMNSTSTTGGTAALIPFTGYHSLAGDGVGKGAFVAISTTETYDSGKMTATAVSLAISLDGKTAKNYTDLAVLGSRGDAVDVSVRDTGAEVMQVHFERAVGGGVTGRCTGKMTASVGGVSAFEGTSYFNQLPLELFKGRYLGMDGKTLIMEINAGAGGTTIRYADPAGGAIQDYPKFTYVPDMYVLSLNPVGGATAPVSIMLGTGGQLGLVAGITTASGMVYAVSVPPAMPTGA